VAGLVERLYSVAASQVRQAITYTDAVVKGWDGMGYDGRRGRQEDIKRT